jgi:hypothetical protein
MANENISRLLKEISTVIDYLLAPNVLKKGLRTNWLKLSRERAEKITNILNLALSQLKKIK